MYTQLSRLNFWKENYFLTIKGSASCGLGAHQQLSVSNICLQDYFGFCKTPAGPKVLEAMRRVALVDFVGTVKPQSCSNPFCVWVGASDLCGRLDWTWAVLFPSLSCFCTAVSPTRAWGQSWDCAGLQRKVSILSRVQRSSHGPHSSQSDTLGRQTWNRDWAELRE